MITGLEELILKCTVDNARVQVQEAYKCYEAGAYRAAIVTTYVAVCFDLIDKLSALASSGDAEAKSLELQLSNLQVQLDKHDPSAMPALLNFERNLLEVFRDKFEFLGVNEFEELARLRHDRNRCAHPTFVHSAIPFNPPAELARLHIRNALELVLSQQPRQGKAALKSLQAIVLSEYFPTEEAEALERLKGSEIASAKSSLVTAFVDDLMFGWTDPTSGYHKKRSVLLALNGTIELQRSLALPRIASNTEKLLKSSDLNAIRLGAAVAVRYAEVGEALSGPAKAVIKRWLSNPSTPSRASSIRLSRKIGWLADYAEKQIATLTSEELSKISGPIPAKMISRAAEIYAAVSNWSEANKVAAECAIPLAEHFSVSDIELVLKAADDGSADLRGSGGFNRFISALYDRNPIGSEPLKALLTEHHLDDYIKG